MISGFRNKTLERAFCSGSNKGLPAEFVAKIRRVLLALDQAQRADDLRIPGFGLHPLTGDLRGFWSIVVSRNWRITFRFEGTDAGEVDLTDYH